MSSVSRAFSICFCFGIARDRAHVVQAVGELDQDDPDVRGHRDHHLAVVLGLRLVARLERQPGQLGDAVDEAGDLLAERRLHLLERGGGVLDGVVQQRGAQRLGVEPHAGADLRDADRMDDEVLARLAPLVGVVHAGVDERLLDAVAVDRDRGLVGVLLDDREQVAEQPPLGRRSARPARSTRACPDARRRSTGGREAGISAARAIAGRPRLPLGPGAVGVREPARPRRGAGSAAWSEICAAQESSSVLVSLCIDPVGRRALERGLRRARDRQGRQIPVEADELQLREDPDQPAGQPWRTSMRTIAAKQSLELLAGHPPPEPQAPVERDERSAETVLQLVHLLSKA